MKLLEAEPTLAPSAPAEPARQTPPASPSDAAGDRTCKACGTAMAADQDWCLSCGAAAAGPAGRRPGWRAAASVIGLTLALVVGAVAASYAALTDDPPATPPQPVAQVPATEPAAPATPTDTAPAETPTTTAPADSAPPADLPTVPTPGETPAITPSPTPVSPPADTPDTPAGEVPATPDTATPTAPELTPITLADGAVTVYDPYGRASATGDPGRLLDDNAATSWYVDPKDPELIGVGLAIDLGELRAVKAIELVTTTPGFRVEVYGTDEATLPPDILDTRWTHVRDVKDAGVVDPEKADDVEGEERIVLGAGTTKYRNLVLWLTGPPTERPRLRITELKLFR